MMKMLTVKETAEATGMSEYAIRKGVTSGIYPAIRVCGNPKGKILINFNEFTATLNNMASRNISKGGIGADKGTVGNIRKIAE